MDGTESRTLSAGPGTHTDPLGELTATLAPWGIEVNAVHRVEVTGRERVFGDSFKVYARCSVDGHVFWGCGVSSDPHAAAFSAVRVAATRAGQIQESDPAAAPAPMSRLAERVQ